MNNTNDVSQSHRKNQNAVLQCCSSSNQVVGQSPAFLKVIEVALRAARSNSKVFITGESGTGKEVIAKLIHYSSAQKDGPFIAINCSAIPEQLLESELFGHAKGSFSGANEKRIGIFEEAQNGTLFLDEIGDLSLPLQSKLLRVLQEKKIKRVGENQCRDINCRIISATHKDLISEIKEHRFRDDLYFRLEVIPINIPPLRERPEDLPLLADFFLRRYASENNSRARCFSQQAKEFVQKYTWPGNIRELENTIERAVVLSENEEVSLAEFVSLKQFLYSDQTVSSADPRQPYFSIQFRDNLPTVEEVVKNYVEFAVRFRAGARDKTAKEIGIDRKTLYKHLRNNNSDQL